MELVRVFIKLPRGHLTLEYPRATYEVDHTNPLVGHLKVLDRHGDEIANFPLREWIGVERVDEGVGPPD